MSKSSIVRLVTAAVCCIAVRNVVERETAVADQHFGPSSARADNSAENGFACPCFRLEDLATVQWGAQLGDSPRYKVGPRLWSITSRSAGAVNAASVHSDLDSCVLLIEFGPDADVFKTDLHLTPAQVQECIEVIEAMRAALNRVP